MIYKRWEFSTLGETLTRVMFDDVCMLKRVKRHWYIWYFIENDPQHLGPFFLALNMDPKR